MSYLGNISNNSIVFGRCYIHLEYKGVGNSLEGGFRQTGKPALEDRGTSRRPCHRSEAPVTGKQWGGSTKS
jgi:hypothetical protein